MKESEIMQRPTWCPHNNCNYLRQVQDAACVGLLPKPEPHDDDWNTHRLCLRVNGDVFDLQVNKTDCWWLTSLLDTVRGDAN